MQDVGACAVDKNRVKTEMRRMNYASVLSDYTAFDFTHGPWTRQVFRRGQGPAVIVMHEIPGLHPLTLRFADRVAAAGMTVFLPSLTGEPGRRISSAYAAKEMWNLVCVRREFTLWATDRSSPIVDWLRALAAKVHADCGGPGVGAVGMCLTGGFALAMMTEPAVIAPVLSQPSLPLPVGSAARSASIGLSPEELACVKRRFETENLSMIGLRYRGDRTVPDARFATYRREFGDRFEAIELDPKTAPPARTQPHSVLTVHFDDRAGKPTKRAEERVIAFLRERTSA
jgi:dienelactone hydrolase